MTRYSAPKIMKLELALYVIMIAVLAFIVASGLTACGTLKRVSKQDIAVKAESVTVSSKTELSTAETKHFGDQVKTTGFIASVDSGITSAFTVESKGLKANIRLTPVFNSKGQKTGDKLDFEAEAKPIALTDNRILKIEDTESNNENSLTQTASQEETKTSSLYSWLTPLIIILVLVAAILFRGWLFKILFK